MGWGGMAIVAWNDRRGIASGDHVRIRSATSEVVKEISPTRVWLLSHRIAAVRGSAGASLPVAGNGT